MKKSGDTHKKPLLELRVGKWHSALHKFPQWPRKIGVKFGLRILDGIGVGIGIGIVIGIHHATDWGKWPVLAALVSHLN